jgi:hypothetical protein
MSCSKGENRKILSDQADEEIRKVDIHTEKLLALTEYLNDEAKSARLNANRELLIAEIRQTLRLNLEHLDELDNNGSTLDPNVLFKHFCFIIVFKNHLRLVFPDRCLSEKQIALVQTLVSVFQSSNNSSVLLDTIELLGKFFYRVPSKKVIWIYFLLICLQYFFYILFK